VSRLHAIADLVPADALAVVDVGYDHGQLLAILATRHPKQRLLGVEVQEDAAGRFAASHAGLTRRVALRCGSGLQPLTRADGVQVAVIAGMGEHRMTDILGAADDAVMAGIQRLVLCPADFRNLLRPWLHERGWAPVEDRLVVERDHWYEVMAYERAEDIPSPGTAKALFGTLGEPDLSRYCRALCQRHAGALAAPSSAVSPVLDKLRFAQAHEAD